MSIRARFAPSPTGYLHVGGLRTALYNFLLAKQTGGQFLLRIEDTDQTRKVDGALESLLTILDKFGLSPDESPAKGGPVGPYIQSERLPIYHKHVNELLDKGHAYRCFCTAERLETMRAAQQAQKLTPKYDRRCLSISREESDRRATAGEPHTVRMKVPHGPAVTFKDEIRGMITYEREAIDDQVLLKSDGFPTYHLAVVVDDHHMKITHVVRGEEWISSTPKHLMLYEFFGWTPPKMCHLPLMLNPDRSKLSKRQGDVAAEDFLAKGYLPEALLNFIALCGWHTADDREFFSLPELVKEFSLDRVNPAAGVFDVTKLQWMNREYIKRLPEDVLCERLRPFLKNLSAGWEKFVPHIRETITFLPEAEEAMTLFTRRPESFAWDPAPDFLKSAETKDLAIEVLEAFKKALQNCTNSQEASTAITGCGDQLKNIRKLKPKEVFMPMRFAILGQGKGPEVPVLAGIFGAPEIIRRIELAIARVQNAP